MLCHVFVLRVTNKMFPEGRKHFLIMHYMNIYVKKIVLLSLEENYLKCTYSLITYLISEIGIAIID